MILGAQPPARCWRCQLPNPGSDPCPACGAPASGASSGSPVPQAQAQSIPALSTPPQAAAPAAVTTPTAVVPARAFSEAFGWKRIDGTVIDKSLQQIGFLRHEWWETTLKLLVIVAAVLVFGVTALAVVLAAAFLSLLVSLLMPRRAPRGRPPGFFAGMATQIASFFLFSRLFGPKATVPISEYRIRDAKNDIWLIRVEGYVVQGSFGPGDDVLAEGFEHDGTLFVRRGFNRTLNCSIRVRRR